jgi:glycerophosphoryl diester phosphodiesterase
VRSVPLRWRTVAARLGCATINVDHRRLSPRLAADIRNPGYPLLAYTVNDPERARSLFEWGVTSVFSDAPDIILGVSGQEPSARHIVAGSNSSVGMRQGAIS